jgi:hypothetical protein
LDRHGPKRRDQRRALRCETRSFRPTCFPGFGARCQKRRLPVCPDSSSALDSIGGRQCQKTFWSGNRKKATCGCSCSRYLLGILRCLQLSAFVCLHVPRLLQPEKMKHFSKQTAKSAVAHSVEFDKSSQSHFPPAAAPPKLPPPPASDRPDKLISHGFGRRSSCAAAAATTHS